MRLIDTATQRELKVGDRVMTFRRQKATLEGWAEPRHEGSTGRVLLRFGKTDGPLEYYPGVIGAQFVE